MKRCGYPDCDHRAEWTVIADCEELTSVAPACNEHVVIVADAVLVHAAALRAELRRI